MSRAKQEERTPWRYLTITNAAARLRKKRTNDKVAGDLRESSGSSEGRFQSIKEKRRPDLMSLSRRSKGRDSESPLCAGQASCRG